MAPIRSKRQGKNFMPYSRDDKAENKPQSERIEEESHSSGIRGFVSKLFGWKKKDVQPDKKSSEQSTDEEWTDVEPKDQNNTPMDTNEFGSNSQPGNESSDFGEATLKLERFFAKKRENNEPINEVEQEGILRLLSQANGKESSSPVQNIATTRLAPTFHQSSPNVSRIMPIDSPAKNSSMLSPAPQNITQGVSSFERSASPFATMPYAARASPRPVYHGPGSSTRALHRRSNLFRRPINSHAPQSANSSFSSPSNSPLATDFGPAARVPSRSPSENTIPFPKRTRLDSSWGDASMSIANTPSKTTVTPSNSSPIQPLTQQPTSDLQTPSNTAVTNTPKYPESQKKTAPSSTAASVMLNIIETSKPKPGLNKTKLANPYDTNDNPIARVPRSRSIVKPREKVSREALLNRKPKMSPLERLEKTMPAELQPVINQSKSNAINAMRTSGSKAPTNKTSQVPSSSFNFKVASTVSGSEKTPQQSTSGSITTDGVNKMVSVAVTAPAPNPLISTTTTATTTTTTTTTTVEPASSTTPKPVPSAFSLAANKTKPSSTAASIISQSVVSSSPSPSKKPELSTPSVLSDSNNLLMNSDIPKAELSRPSIFQAQASTFAPHTNKTNSSTEMTTSTTSTNNYRAQKQQKVGDDDGKAIALAKSESSLPHFEFDIVVSQYVERNNSTQNDDNLYKQKVLEKGKTTLPNFVFL